MRRFLAATAAILCVSIGVGAPAQADPHIRQSTVVKLRVEGATSTIFEGWAHTRGRDVTTVSGGTHHCDGTNNNANPKPGATPTGALDDGARKAGFTFDGTYSAEFDDFFITRVGPDAQTASQFWGILVDGALIDVGGCQQQVRMGDEVLFAFDAFGKAHALELSGPVLVRTGQPATYRVTDESTGAPLSNATVFGGTTDANGYVTLRFTQRGVVPLKAERSDSIRSNGLSVRVR